MGEPYPCCQRCRLEQQCLVPRTGDRTRTCTERNLNPLPLPIGLHRLAIRLSQGPGGPPTRYPDVDSGALRFARTWWHLRTVYRIRTGVLLIENQTS